MQNYYVLKHGGFAYVKGEAFFESQGGMVDGWGKTWTRIKADSVEDARAKCLAMGEGELIGRQ